jgi:hypothetical protein
MPQTGSRGLTLRRRNVSALLITLDEVKGVIGRGKEVKKAPTSW